MTSETKYLTAADRTRFAVDICVPAAVPATGIVLLPEIFGLTPWLKETAEMFAAQGFVVAAMEVFSRLSPGFVGDPNRPEDVKRGLTMRGELDVDLAVSDIDLTMTMLRETTQCAGQIATVGFCMGGTLAFLAACRLNPDAAVAYYGTQIHEYLDEASAAECPTLLHIGIHDELVPPPLQARIHEVLDSLALYELREYEAGHAFANSHRSAGYDAPAARLAHNATLAMLRRAIDD